MSQVSWVKQMMALTHTRVERLSTIFIYFPAGIVAWILMIDESAGRGSGKAGSQKTLENSLETWLVW